jgi:MYXO-CTERM domain-containing protein
MRFVVNQVFVRCAGLAVAAVGGAAVVAPFARADAMSFQQGVSPTGTYANLGQDIRGNAVSNTGADTLVGEQFGGVAQIRTVLGWDLSSLPAGATITGVTLTMTVNNTGSGTVSGLGTIEVHEVVPNGVASNNMVENQVTYASWKTGSAWTTAGGDFSATTLSSAGVVDSDGQNDFDNGEKATFTSTAAFVTAAQNAFDAGLPLELILLSPTAEAATASNFARFGSDDATTAGNRPLLSVTYSVVPEPASAGWAILAVGAGLVRRRRRTAGAPA